MPKLLIWNLHKLRTKWTWTKMMKNPYKTLKSYIWGKNVSNFIVCDVITNLKTFYSFIFCQVFTRIKLVTFYFFKTIESFAFVSLIYKFFINSFSANSAISKNFLNFSERLGDFFHFLEFFKVFMHNYMKLKTFLDLNSLIFEYLWKILVFQNSL